MSSTPIHALRLSTKEPDNQTYLLLQTNDRVDLELIDKAGYTLHTLLLTLANGQLTHVARPSTKPPASMAPTPKRCANSPCPGFAQWELRTPSHDTSPNATITYACTEHVGLLLDDQTSTHVTPLTQPLP